MPQTLARRYLLLPRPGHPELLLCESDSGWTLPYVTLDRHFYSLAAPLTAAVRQAYGLEIFLLRAVYRHPAPRRIMPTGCCRRPT